MKKELSIESTQGLHAQLAAKLVDVTTQFHSDIRLEYADQTVDAKSVLGLMSLAVPAGENITVVAEGKDAEAVIQEIEKLLDE